MNHFRMFNFVCKVVDTIIFWGSMVMNITALIVMCVFLVFRGKLTAHNVSSIKKLFRTPNNVFHH